MKKVDEKQEEMGREYSEAISVLKSARISAPPFMKARVLANINSGKSENQGRLWKFVAAFSMTVAVAVIVFSTVFLSGKPEVTRIVVGESYVISFNISDVDDSKVAYAEITVPDNMSFISESIDNIAGIEKIRLSWSKLAKMESLPVPVSGDFTGRGPVTIDFYASDGSRISSKTIELDVVKQETGEV